MKESAFIKFTYLGKEYTWKGSWDEALEDVVGDTIAQIPEGTGEGSLDMAPPVVKIIEAMGGQVLEIHSTRDDGTIQDEDLAEFFYF